MSYRRIIDIIGRPLTPVSFAAAVGAVAYGAYARRACGYYPNPPCC